MRGGREAASLLRRLSSIGSGPAGASMARQRINGREEVLSEFESRAAKKLQEAAILARDMGYDDLAKDLGAAGVRFGKIDGLATDMGKVVGVKKDLDLLKRFIRATDAMIAVDMRSGDAGPVFDEFFAVAGEMGGEMLKFGGIWGEVLAPYAAFVQKLGESGFFAKMKENFAMHGTKHGVNIYALDNAETDR